ncbi:YczE/YyaS/YitT family protein [Alkalibacterium sp. f15]|uniref:YczE/YyaS/YitT family protein n=1 Tax=Alkalibacterium sp. f15 TaxID=3414029 RepID=UPI003BF7FDAA
MKNYKGYALLSLFSAGVALAITFMLKASVGLGPFDAVIQSISLLSGIRIGTVSMMLNLSCVIGQLIILKKDFGFNRFLQIPLSILIGILVNYFYYNLFASVEFNSYALSLIVFILGLVLAVFSVSMVMVLNLVTFPIESLCMALTKKIPLKFAVIRQIADILFVVISVALTIIFGLVPSVREGTIIGMLIFGPLMGFFIEKVHPVLTKRGIIEEIRI